MNYYRDLLRQGARIEPFRRAIQAVVGPDDRVLEVGAGVGTYSFFASDAGAARVWAVEGDPVLHVAETIANLQGYAGKIEFIRGWSPDVEIPERATVLIFEDFPTRLLDAGTFRLLGKLRDRYLTPDARFVPHRARIFTAPVSAESGLVSSLAPLSEKDDTAYGIDWEPTREYVVNTAHCVTAPANAVTEEPAIVADMILDSLPTADQLGGTVNWTCTVETKVSGLLYWFDLELLPGDWISNAPGALPGSWGQLFLPIDPPLCVSAGESLTVSVRPDSLEDGAPGWLAWSASARGTKVSGHEFASMPAAFSDLYAKSPQAIPCLNGKGHVDAMVFKLVDGERSVREIAKELECTIDGLSHLDAVNIVLRALEGRTQRTSLLDARLG